MRVVEGRDAASLEWESEGPLVRIWAESEVGRGTTLSFTLPLVAAGAEAREREAPGAEVLPEPVT